MQHWTNNRFEEMGELANNCKTSFSYIDRLHYEERAHLFLGLRWHLLEWHAVNNDGTKFSYKDMNDQYSRLC